MLHRRRQKESNSRKGYSGGQLNKSGRGISRGIHESKHCRHVLLTLTLTELVGLIIFFLKKNYDGQWMDQNNHPENEDKTIRFGDNAIHKDTNTKMSGWPRPHPHAGAKFPNGTLGLIIDPSTKFSPPNQTRLLQRERNCKVDSTIDKVSFEVFKRIRSGVIKAKSQNIKKTNLPKMKTSSTVSLVRDPRIICMVYTHSNAHSRIQAIFNTWGKECDGFFAASNATDPSIGAMHLSHKGPEAYGNMWQKIRSMWAYAHDNFLDDYDYFHISGDDSYVVVANMKAYLQGEQISRLLNGYIDTISRTRYNQAKQWENLEKGQQRPLLLGFPAAFKGSMYPVGGSGYTLNKEALRLIGVEGGPLDTILSDYEDPREDVFITSVLEEIGTFISDTRDDTGAFRYIRHRPIDVRITSFPSRFNIPTTRGLGQFSNETVALHLKDMDKKEKMVEVIYRIHDILSGECDGNIF